MNKYTEGKRKWYFILTFLFAFILMVADIIHIESLLAKQADLNRDAIYVRLGDTLELAVRFLIYTWIPAIYVLSRHAQTVERKLEQHLIYPIAYTVHFVGFIFILGLIEFPLELFLYIRNYYFHLTSQSFLAFIQSFFNQLLIFRVLPACFIYGFVFIVRKYKQKWWLYGAGIMTVLLLLSSILYPAVIDPVAASYESLERPILQEETDKMAEAANVRPIPVYVAQKSRKTNTINAYMTGMLGSQRIVLWDTLLKELSHKETLNVIAHEIGHYKSGHMARLWLWNSFKYLIVFMAIHLIFIKDVFSVRRFARKGRITDISFSPVLFILLFLLMFILRPADMNISRRHEREADRYEIELMKDRTGAAQVLDKIGEKNLEIPSVPLIYRWFYQTHPLPQERIEFYKTYKN